MLAYWALWAQWKGQQKQQCTHHTHYFVCSQDHSLTSSLSFLFCTSSIWRGEFTHQGNTTWARTRASCIWHLHSNLFKSIATSVPRTASDHVKQPAPVSRSQADPLRLRLITLSCYSRWGFTEARATGHQALFAASPWVEANLCPLRIAWADFKRLWFKDIHCMFWHSSCGASKALASAHTAGIPPCWSRTSWLIHFCPILAQQQADGASALVSCWFCIFFSHVCVMLQSIVLQILPPWVPKNIRASS